MPDYELIIPLIIVLVGLFLLVYFLIDFSKVVENGVTVRVADKGSLCNPSLGSLSVIPDKLCQDENGSNVQCYQPDESMDLIFEISQVPYYFASVCSRICGSISIEGGCEEENENYKECINLLEPPSPCNNTANPIGRLTGTNTIYYAKKVL